MEAYPAEYVQHNLPFVVLSGLGSKNDLEPLPPVHQVLPGEAATSISCEIASVTGEHANQLLQEFLKADGTNAPWNGRMQNRRGNLLGFRIRTVGRVGQAPATLAVWTACSLRIGLYTAPQEG